MAIVLDGVTLSGSLQWKDRFEFSPVAQATKRTLGGGLVVFSHSLVAGRPVTLEATEETGWITKAMLDSLQSKAAVPGAVYSFEYHGEVLSVVFRHDEPPAVGFTPLVPKATADAGDYYVGTLKLLTV